MNFIVKAIKTFSCSPSEVKGLIGEHNKRIKERVEDSDSDGNGNGNETENGSERIKVDSSSKEIKAILVTIPFSHFCEKARWVLDLSPLSDHYMEDAHAAGLHQIVTKTLTKGKFSSVPQLVVFEERNKKNENEKEIEMGLETKKDGILTCSTEIVVSIVDQHPDQLAYLLPSEKREDILKLITKLDEELGPSARQVAYSYLLPSKEGYKITQEAMGRFSPLIESLLVPFFMPVFKSLMMKLYDNASEQSKEKALLKCKNIFQDISILLEKQDKNSFSSSSKTSSTSVSPSSSHQQFILGGKTPTLADITFASLAYPIISPPGSFDTLMAPISSFPSTMIPIIEEMRATTAGRHALAMYKYYRFPQAQQQQPILPKIMAKTINRNKNFGTFSIAAASACTVAAMAIAYGIQSGQNNSPSISKL